MIVCLTEEEFRTAEFCRKAIELSRCAVVMSDDQTEFRVVKHRYLAVLPTNLPASVLLKIGMIRSYMTVFQLSTHLGSDVDLRGSLSENFNWGGDGHP